jgi:hypothetical protein
MGKKCPDGPGRNGSASELPPVDPHCFIAINTMATHDPPNLKLDQSLRG